MKYILLIILLTFCLTENMLSQIIEDAVSVSNTPNGLIETAPFMQLGNDAAIYVSWIRYTGQAAGDTYFASSSDNGLTFSAPSKLTTNGLINGNFQRGMKFVIDKKKILHAVWMENKVNNQPDIWYSKSTDNGINWTQQSSVMDLDDSLKHTQDFCDIAVDSNNKLYISFLDAREKQRNLSENLQLYLTTSTDMGATWSQNRKVNDMPANEGGTCECCSQSIEVSPEGNIYIAFRTNINNRRDIFLARSLNKGITFEKTFPIQNSNWTINACPVTGPKIALDNMENLHCVWFDDRDDSPPAVYYALIPFGSSQTPENIRLSQNSYTGVNYPDVSISKDGKIAIAYQTYNQNARFYFGDNPALDYSDSPISNVNSEKKFVNIIAKNNNEIYLCWQDSRRDAGDIYFKKIQFNTSSVSESISNNFNNAILSKLLSHGKIEIRIFDMLGYLKCQIETDGYDFENFNCQLSKRMQDFSSGLYLINYYNGHNYYSKLISIVK